MSRYFSFLLLIYLSAYITLASGQSSTDAPTSAPTAAGGSPATAAGGSPATAAPTAAPTAAGGSPATAAPTAAGGSPATAAPTAAGGSPATAAPTAAGGSPATAGPTAAGGSPATAAPTAAAGPTTTTTAAPTTKPLRQNAKQVGCETKINADYDVVTANETIKQSMLNDCKESVRKSANCKSDQIKNGGFRRSSLIYFFDFVVSPSGGGISPAEATAALKIAVTSGTFVITSSVLGNLTVDATYFKAAEPSGITCYSCSNTAVCSKKATATHPTATCVGDQNCWVNSTKTTSTSYYRECGEPCTTTYKTKVCVTKGSKYECAKCCSTANCNSEVLATAGGASIAITPLLLFVGVILHYTFNKNV